MSASAESTSLNSVRNQIRTALACSSGGLTARQIHESCDETGTLQELIQDLHALKGEGKVLADGMRNSQVIYKIGKWPVNGAAAKDHVVRDEQSRVTKPSHTITSLREGLFEMQAKLRSGNVDVQTAKTYAALAMTIIKSVEVQLDYERLRLEAKLPSNLTDIPLVPALEHKP